MKATILILLVLFVMAMVPGCATQEDAVILDSRIRQTNQDYDDLQKKLYTLQKQTDALNAANEKLATELASFKKSRESEDQRLRQQAAELRSVTETLREDIQKLQGRIEESGHAMKKDVENAEATEQKLRLTIERLEKKIQAGQDRTARLEQYLNLETVSKKPAPPPGAVADSSKAAPKTDSAERLYRAAKQAFDKEDFETALGGFQKFVKRYPKSQNADNAQFWIGEIYYREKWYEKAILEYQKVIEKYPRGNKVQASLLKQGFAFFNIGDQTNGRLILKELIKKYPKSTEAKIAAKRLK